MDASGAALRDGTGLRSSAVSQRLRAMHPAYFAMSMSTGIVSIACHLLGLRDLSSLLFAINVVAYGALWVATIARFVRFRREFLADISSHQRGPGYFTTVAATCVTGLQFQLLGDAPGVALTFWIAGLLLWTITTYAVFVAISVREEKPSLADGINGGWLVAVVATQSVCALGCGVLPRVLGDRETAWFLLTSCWLCGGMLYLWMISLIFYRYTFFRFSPSDLMPPYWINMGAAAVSTLAGTWLLSAGGDSGLMGSIRPFVRGFTILWWATATWWIPMLAALGVWRHAVRRVRFGYDPLYWGLVFPLGMYSVCTWRVAVAFDLPALVWVARVFVVLALVAWLLTFFGLATRFLVLLLTSSRSVRPPYPAPAPSIASFPALARSNAGQPSP
ncbi:MAG: tellurite resistance/C4-dicarboxylate transporter family protein [Planctomycetia bacterium]|nr:tellurite resistance/C4-dicarboxylate transporter family protein [Planctomycetia bacterium]